MSPRPKKAAEELRQSDRASDDCDETDLGLVLGNRPGTNRIVSVVRNPSAVSVMSVEDMGGGLDVEEKTENGGLHRDILNARSFRDFRSGR